MQNLNPNRQIASGTSPKTTIPTESGYATSPLRPNLKGSNTHQVQVEPAFCNALHLKTIGANLYIGFGFQGEGNQEEPSEHRSSKLSIVLGNETAKQLLFSLAELFQCELQIKE